MDITSVNSGISLNGSSSTATGKAVRAGAAAAAPSGSGAISSGPTSSDESQMREVAQQFEAIFLRQMIGSMRSSSLAEGMFDSSATQQFRDMADAKTADEMARTSRFGIADLLMKQFAPKTPLSTGSINAASAAAKMNEAATANEQLAHAASTNQGDGL